MSGLKKRDSFYNVFGLNSRFSNRFPQHDIHSPELAHMKERARELLREEFIEDRNNLKKLELRNQWERDVEKKARFIEQQRKNKKDEVDEIDKDLAKRRLNLQVLLDREDETFKKELEKKKYNVEDKIDEMKSRMEKLMLQREQRIKEIVEEKRLLQHRANSSTFREHLSDQVMHQIAADQKEQMKLNKEIRDQRKEEDNKYDELWSAETCRKWQQEQEELRQRKQLNYETKMEQKEQMIEKVKEDIKLD